MPTIKGKWIWNEAISPDIDGNLASEVTFTSNGKVWKSVSVLLIYEHLTMSYYSTSGSILGAEVVTTYIDEVFAVLPEYREMDFGTVAQEVTDEFYNYLIANATHKSTAKRLAEIAENEQKVYDAGYEKGKAEGGGNISGDEITTGRLLADEIQVGVNGETIINDGGIYLNNRQEQEIVVGFDDEVVINGEDGISLSGSAKLRINGEDIIEKIEQMGENGGGKDGISATHSWNGTVLTITSASGTSSADLKGDKGDKGDKGAPGSVKFEELTEEQKNELRGTSVDDVARAAVFYDEEIETDITGNLTIEVDWYYTTDLGKVNLTNNNRACSSLIPVRVGDKFKISAQYGYNVPLVAEFDSTQTMVSYSATKDGGNEIATDYEYTVPGNISYIAINTRHQKNYPIKVIKVAKDNVKMHIEALEETVGGLSELPVQVEQNTADMEALKAESDNVVGVIGKSKTIVDITNTVKTATAGWYHKDTGKVSPATHAQCTEIFPVEVGETYYVNGEYGYYACLIAEFDADMNFIGAVGTGGSETIVAVGYKYTVPTGVAFIGCSSRTSSSQAQYYLDLSVKKEISTLNNVQEDITVAVEDSAVEKLDKVLCSPNGAEWVLTISNDGNIVPIKLRATGSGVNTAITLPQTLSVGTYTLKYEDANGVVADYLDICSLEVTTSGMAVSYNGLIPQNCAPEGVTRIGVYNASNQRVAEIDLGFLSNKYSGKLYSFGAISDVHIGQADGVEDFTNAVAYFEGNDEVEFTTICGDMVDKSSNKDWLASYQSIARDAEKPIYVVMGNHEALNYATGENFDSIKSYFAQDNYPDINQELYYTFTRNDDVFIMVGVYGSYNNNKTFSQEQLQWLYETLEENRNKRCFLFLHYFPKDGSGDAVECYDADGLQGYQGEVFYNLMKHYKNVIYFHGHSHAKFKVQELNAMNTIDSVYGRYSVHIPSLTWPTYPNDAMTEYNKDSYAGEGYIVDVYEHGIALRGRDFENGKFSPIGSYYLDTVIEKIAANSFRDETGTIETTSK